MFDSINVSGLMDFAVQGVVGYTPKIIGAIIVLFIGFKIANVIANMIDKLLEKKGLDPTMNAFLASLIRNLLKAMVVVAAIGILGVQTSAFVAAFAAVGLAIGMALSGTLGHFASGVMILLFKPYKVGDLIETAGQFGTVNEVQIFNTMLTTLDAKTIIIPNSTAIGGCITNYSMKDIKRVDIDVGIAYSDSIDIARATLQKIADSDKRVLKDKGITIAVKELADSAVVFTFRTFCSTGDYWDVLFDLTEQIKKKFDETDGISFPFPQRDVHLYNVK